MAGSEFSKSGEALGCELAEPLNHLPPVEFACAYGSGVFPQPGRIVKDEEPMVDYIFGVADPLQWHTENLQRNRDHYSFIMAHFGPKTVTKVAEKIGVGVHFNAFVPWKDKVHILRDNLSLENVNVANLKGATSAALLLLPPEFSEEDLFVKICGLSYMGDLRMFFAEDIHKAKKIVNGNISRFRTLYKDQIHHLAETGLLKLHSSAGDFHTKFIQDSSVSATRSLVSALPPAIRSRMGAELGEKITINNFGREVSLVVVKTREDAANSMQRAIKSIVRVSSLRQAFSGCLAAGGVNAASYLAKKVLKHGGRGSD